MAAKQQASKYDSGSETLEEPGPNLKRRGSWQGLFNSADPTEDINELRLELRKEVYEIKQTVGPLKGAVDELLDWKKSSGRGATPGRVQHGTGSEEALEDIRRTVEGLNLFLENLKDESEEHRLEVENERRATKGEILSIKENLQKELQDREAQHNQVWAATQDLMSSFEEATQDQNKQYLEWQDFQEEASRDFERARKILDFLLLQSFDDLKKARKDIVDNDSGETILGHKGLGEPSMGARVQSRSNSVVDILDQVNNQSRGSILGTSATEDGTAVPANQLESPGLELVEAKLTRIKTDSEKFGEDVALLQKESKALLKRNSQLETETVRKTQFDVLQKETTETSLKMLTVEQDMSKLVAKYHSHKQQLTEATESQDRIAAQLRSQIAELKAATQNIVQVQADLQALVQSQLRSQATTISDIEFQLESDFITRKEFQGAGGIMAGGQGGDLSDVKAEIQAEIDQNHRLVWEAVFQLQMKQHDLSKRREELIEGAMSYQPSQTKSILWGAMVGSQSPNPTATAVFPEENGTSQQVPPLNLDGMTVVLPPQNSTKAFSSTDDGLATSLSLGTPSPKEGGSVKALNADPRSGSQTPTQSLRPVAPVQGGYVLSGTAPGSWTQSRDVSPALNRSVSSGALPIQSNDISPSLNHSLSSGALRIMSPQTTPAVASPAASPAAPSPRMMTVPNLLSPPIASYSPVYRNSPNGPTPLNVVSLGSGS